MAPFYRAPTSIRNLNGTRTTTRFTVCDATIEHAPQDPERNDPVAKKPPKALPDPEKAAERIRAAAAAKNAAAPTEAEVEQPTEPAAVTEPAPAPAPADAAPATEPEPAAEPAAAPEPEPTPEPAGEPVPEPAPETTPAVVVPLARYATTSASYLRGLVYLELESYESDAERAVDRTVETIAACFDLDPDRVVADYHLYRAGGPRKAEKAPRVAKPRTQRTKIQARGVKGPEGKPFFRKFRSVERMNLWVLKNNATVQEHKEVQVIRKG